MTQQASPWLEAAYGWDYGENGWNTGMDSNLLKFSVMFDRNVDSIVATLPPAVNGQVHYNTTDNRLYFAVNTTYFSTVVPKWFTLVVRSTGANWQFNGLALVAVESVGSLDTRLDAVELTLSTLGSAAFEDVSAFATAAELDIVEGQGQAYTDTLRQDLANDTDPAKGAAMVAYAGGNVSEALDKRTIYVGSVAELEAMSLDEGVNVYLTQEGRAGDFVIRTGTPPSDLQKGLYIVLANGNYAQRTGVKFATPEMFGGAADASIDDATGTTSGTDNTQAFIAALATGLPVIASKGGYFTDSLSVPSNAVLITLGEGWITGPMNKPALRIGSDDPLSPVAVEKIHIDVRTQHPLQFETVALATDAGYPNAAILSNNYLTAGISHENVRDSYIKLRHRGGRYGLYSTHDHDSNSTPPVPATSERSRRNYYDVEAVDSWTGFHSRCEDMPGGRALSRHTVLKHDAYNANGCVISGPASGSFDSLIASDGRVGITIEHEIPDLYIGVIDSKNNTHRNIVFGKGTEPTGPNLKIGTIISDGPTDPTQFAVDNFEATISIGRLIAKNPGLWGVRNNEGSTFVVDYAYIEGATDRAVNNFGGLFRAGTLELKDCSDIGLLSTGATGVAEVDTLRGISGNGKLFQISGGEVSLGRVCGISSTNSIVATGVAGTLVDLDFSKFTGVSQGMTFQEPPASFNIGKITYRDGRSEIFIAPGIVKTFGTGSPEGVIAASVGSEYTRLDPIDTVTIKYLKTSGGGATGWSTS